MSPSRWSARPRAAARPRCVAALGRAAVQHVAWVTLEPGDDEPGRLWDAVLTALELAGAVPPDSALAALAAAGARVARRVHAAAGQRARRAAGAGRAGARRRARAALARVPRRSCRFLLLHAPDTLRLVLTARSDPALPLHVLRVRGRLAEIRAADLAFTEDEAARAARRARPRPRRTSWSHALHARTEGWGAGLRLAALSLQGRDDPERFVAEFAGDDRVVGDYLLAEVLDRQPPRLRAFLLRTSIVDRVCGEPRRRADRRGARRGHAGRRSSAPTGSSSASTRHREWFRYHRLFAKLLRTRAERELAAELPELHAPRRALVRRARRVRSRRSSTPSRRADWDLAVEVVAEHWFDLYVRGDARRGPRARSTRSPRDRLRARRRARRGARLRGARRRRHRRGASCTSRTPRPRPAAARAAPPPLPGDAGARAPGHARGWRATSRPRSRPPTSCWPRPPRTAAVRRRRRAGARARDARRDRAVGATGSTAPGEELQQGGRARARAPARLRRGRRRSATSRCST